MPRLLPKIEARWLFEDLPPDDKELEEQGFTHLYYSPYRPLDFWCRIPDTVVYKRHLMSKTTLPADQVKSLELVPLTAEDYGLYLLEVYRRDHPEGAICLQSETFAKGSVIFPSPYVDGKYQITWFDKHGFGGHIIEDSEALAMYHAYIGGDRQFAPRLLDNLMRLDTFK